MTQPWILGLDGGGTKTALAYANAAGEVVGPYTGPGINPFDQPRWAKLLAELLAAHPAPGPLAHASLGFPGYGESDAVSSEQQEVAHLLIQAPVSIMNDVEVAFRGAFPDTVGVLLLAGTGSMAWASDGERHVRAGGWGEGFGDEGSAYWIGREALSLCSQSLDGRWPDPSFATGLLEHMDLPTHGDDVQAALLEWYYHLSHQRSEVAALTRYVKQMALDGNSGALTLLGRAADQLTRHVHSARRQLGQPDLPWSYAGGVLRTDLMRGLIAERLGSAPQAPVLSPIGGALWHAAKQALPARASDWAARVNFGLEYGSPVSG